MVFSGLQEETQPLKCDTRDSFWAGLCPPPWFHWCFHLRCCADPRTDSSWMHPPLWCPGAFAEAVPPSDGLALPHCHQRHPLPSPLRGAFLARTSRNWTSGLGHHVTASISIPCVVHHITSTSQTLRAYLDPRNYDTYSTSPSLTMSLAAGQCLSLLTAVARTTFCRLWEYHLPPIALYFNFRHHQGGASDMCS